MTSLPSQRNLEPGIPAPTVNKSPPQLTCVASRHLGDVYRFFFSNGRSSGLVEERRGCLAHMYPPWASPGHRHFWRCCHWTPQDEAPSQDEGCRAGTLEQLVEHLVPAQLTGEHFFIPTFLSTYRKFTSTEHVLDLLFQTLKPLRVWTCLQAESTDIPDYCKQATTQGETTSNCPIPPQVQ
ncbi:uncharacterized protein RHO17_021913 [Thomomys bottae]